MRPRDSFVGQPVRSLQTMLRVISEDDGSLPTVIPDGIYGQETMRAIIAFQRRNDLPATGVADQQTWDAIVPAYEEAYTRIGKAESIEIVMDPGKVYHLGDRSPYLYLTQSMLLYLSTIHANIGTPTNSGVLDPPTSEALAAFQLLSGLTPTGELDKITWKYLARQFTLNANRFPD